MFLYEIREFRVRSCTAFENMGCIMRSCTVFENMCACGVRSCTTFENGGSILVRHSRVVCLFLYEIREFRARSCTRFEKICFVLVRNSRKCASFLYEIREFSLADHILCIVFVFLLLVRRWFVGDFRDVRCHVLA